jgi:hypothetical protein
MATWKTVTVNPSGGDYVSLNAALAGEATDVTAQSGDLVISCENFEDTTEVAWPSGFTSDETHRVVITAADDHGGKWSTSAYRLNVEGTVDDGCFRYNQSSDSNYIVFQGIQFREYGSVDGVHGLRLQTGAATTVKLDKCILIGDHADADTLVRGIRTDDNDFRLIMSNTLIYGWNDGLLLTQSTTGGDHIIYNCTIDGAGRYGLFYKGFAAGAIKVKNTRFTNHGTAFLYEQNSGFDAFDSTSDYNLTDDVASSITNWGSNSIDSGDTPTIAYIDDTNSTLTARDYHLDTGDSGIGAGQDLSSDPDLPVTDDIDGDTRG